MSLPEIFPSESLEKIINYLRGQTTDRIDVVQACYDLLGYGLNEIFNKNTLEPRVVGTYVGAVSDGTTLSRDDMARYLEQVSEGSDLKGAISLPKLPPWLVPILLQIIQELLSKAV